MRLTVRAGGGDPIATVALSGELDLATAMLLEGQVDRLLTDQRNQIMVDLSDLTFCDSVGLNALVRMHGRCRAEGGWLQLRCPRGQVADVLAIVGLGHLAAEEG